MPPAIRLHVGLIAKLEAIATAEGCDAEGLVVTACELLVDAYAHRPVTMTNSTAAPALTVSSSLDATVELPAVAEKRRPGRPRKVRSNGEARCSVCDHTRDEHCGENRKCLSARCVCAEFAA